MMKQEIADKHKRSWLNIGVLSLVLFVYSSNLLETRFHPDEASWIGSSDVFEAYFKFEFNSPVWEEGNWHSGQRNGEVYVPIITNSTITRFFIGFFRKIGGISRAEINPPWNFGVSDEENLQEGRKPSDTLLWWARLPMAILASLAIFIVYLLLKDSFGSITGHTWLLFAITSDYFIETFRRAMDEAPLFMGISLIFLCSAKLVNSYNPNQTSSPNKKYLWIALLGLSIGFTGGTKFNGLSTILIGAGVIVVSNFRQHVSLFKKINSSVLDGFLLSAVSYITFIIPNYYLIKHPITGILRMLEYRTWLMPIQQKYVDETMRIYPDRTLHFLYKGIFETYSVMEGVGWLNAILTCAGLIICIAFTIGWAKGIRNSPMYVILVLASVTLSIPVFFIHIDIDRYYMLPVLISTILNSISIGVIFDGWGRPINVKLKDEDNININVGRLEP